MYNGINRKPARPEVPAADDTQDGPRAVSPNATAAKVYPDDRAGFDRERPELGQRQILRGKKRQADDSGVGDDDDRPRPVPPLRSQGTEERRQARLRLGQRLPVGEPEAVRSPLPRPELVRPALAHLTLRQPFPASEANLVQAPIDGGTRDAEGSRDDLRSPDRPAQRTRHDGRDALSQQAAGRTARLPYPVRSQRDVAAALIPALRRPARFAVPDEIDRRTPRGTGPDPSFRDARHDNTIPAIGAAPSSPSSARHRRP